MKYSGKFVLRIPPSLHKALADGAREGGLSLNQLCAHLLETGLSHPAAKPKWLARAQAKIPYLKQRFGSHLLAVAVFGSQVQGRAHSGSDLDLLILLKKSIPIERSLYLWWEETIPKTEGLEISPHFVSLPANPLRPSGFWLEISLNSEILYEKKKVLNRLLARFKEFIDKGEIIRHWSNGHPYWCSRENRVS